MWAFSVVSSQFFCRFKTVSKIFNSILQIRMGTIPFILGSKQNEILRYKSNKIYTRSIYKKITKLMKEIKSCNL